MGCIRSGKIFEYGIYPKRALKKIDVVEWHEMYWFFEYLRDTKRNKLFNRLTKVSP